MRNKFIIIISISLFSFAFTAAGQKLVNSPYSRFNIGSLESSGSFRSLGMGGLGISIRDNSSIYFANPASYSSFDTTSFIFDFGLDYGNIVLSDGISHYSSYDINFNHLMMGFPLKRGWGIAVGVVPMSNGYYNITESSVEGDPGYDPISGGYTAIHVGGGGLNNVFLGTGISINKNFSAGINMTILFGQIKRTNLFEFTDFYNAFNNNSNENMQLSGINFDYGIQYTSTLKNDYFINAGISLSSGKDYKTSYEHFSYRYNAYSSEKDTISWVVDDSTKTFLPGTLKLGISFGKKDKFTAGIDLITTRWTKSTIPGINDNTANTRTILFGAELIPDKFSNYSYIKRVEYRIGSHVGDSYVKVNGEQIKEFGVSAGLGLPMNRSLSKTNIYFDLTRKAGSTSDFLHSENYYTVGISLNLYDWWFLKRKYN